jgi:hypothetical protein
MTCNIVEHGNVQSVFCFDNKRSKPGRPALQALDRCQETLSRHHLACRSCWLVPCFQPEWRVCCWSDDERRPQRVPQCSDPREIWVCTCTHHGKICHGVSVQRRDVRDWWTWLGSVSLGCLLQQKKTEATAMHTTQMPIHISKMFQFDGSGWAGTVFFSFPLQIILPFLHTTHLPLSPWSE